MFDILQPGSLVPYETASKKKTRPEKAAVIIPINNKVEVAPDKPLKEEEPIPFAEWKMPVQEVGYLRGRDRNIL